MTNIESPIIQDNEDGQKAEPSIFVYYKFRLTLDDQIYDGKKPISLYRAQTKSWFEWLQVERYISGKATAGCEVKNTMGDYCNPHFHIHFRSATKKDTIAQAMRRKYLKEYDEKLVGVKMYSLKLEADTCSEDKFFRYAYKQQEPEKELLSCGFALQKTRDLCVAAKASYIVAVEQRQKKAAHKEEASSLYDRLEIYLDKQREQSTSCAILEHILKFYVEEQKPINCNTIVGYYNVYRLKRQLISYVEFARLLSKHNV